ncbi:DegV family protein [Natronospora cellulosivora (SeqCode)]
MENKIALITDSTCDLPKDLLDKFSIEVWPLKIIYKDNEYQDRIDISPKEIYDRFEEEIPSTSMPSPAEMQSKFEELKDKGFTHVIAILISSGLSGTYNVCKMASEGVEGLKIEVIDSKLLSLGLGRLVLYARNLIDEGKLGFEEMVENIKNKTDDVNLNFVVGTLKYLKAGGRIGRVRGTIGELLNIKPIISINEEGVYYTIDKARSRKASLNKLFNNLKEKVKDGLCYVDVLHANAEEEAQALIDKFKKLSNVKGTFFGEVGPAIAVHAGPGLIGVCVTYLSNKTFDLE